MEKPTKEHLDEKIEEPAKEYLEEKIEEGDNDAIKQYIIKAFDRKHGPKKTYRFYLTLAQLYSRYTDTIQQLICTVPKWGYRKDFLYLLAAAKKKKVYAMTEFIYDHIVVELKKDIEKYHNEEKISTLAKWLPREGTSFDKLLNFVEKICKLLYPGVLRLTARARYRKLIIGLSKYIGITEQHLCAKEYDKLEFEHIPKVCYKKNFNTFKSEKHPESRKRFKEYLLGKYNRYSLSGLVSLVFSKDLSEFERDIIDSIWEKNRRFYLEQMICDIGDHISDADIMIDLSRTIFDSKHICVVIALCLLCLYTKNNIIVNAQTPFLLKIPSTKFCDIIKNIEMECCSCPEMMIVDGVKLTTNNNVIIITDKPYNFCNKSSKNIYYWKLTDSRDMVKN